MDINKVRKDIADRSVYFALKEPELYALIIKTFTGSGKTTSVLNAIDEAHLRWIYVAPFHKVIEKNVKRSPVRHFDFLHLEGREKCCLRTDLRPLIDAGVNISGFCDECNFKERQCSYYINRHNAYTELPNLAVTHAHIQTFLPKFLNTEFGDHLIRDYYDVMIIDENPISCFLHQKQLTTNELVYIREVMTFASVRDELIQFMDCIIPVDVDYDRISGLNLHELNAINENKNFCLRVADLFINHVIGAIPPNIIPLIFEIISRANVRNLDDMIFYDRKKKLLNLIYFVDDALDLGLRIIGLDGTANDIVWEAMLGTDNFDSFERDHTYEHVYQLNGGRYCITAWKMNESIQDKICSIIDKIANRKKRGVLVLGTKWSNKVVARKCNSKNLHYATFYNLRSFNDYYKQCDTLVLPIEPNIPEDTMKSYVALSDWDESLWRKITREEEMLQGIGRIRQNIKYLEDLNIDRETPIEIFILSSTGLRKIKTTDIDKALATEEIGYFDEMYVDYIPTLVEEANVITMGQLSMHLDGKIDLNASVGTIDNILNICPTTATEIGDTLNLTRSKVRKYIKYMLRRRLIKKDGNKYDITKRGYQKLTPEKKNERTI